MNKKNLVPLFVLLLSFFQVFSEDYFWVGGQGDWSDLNSWRTNMGQIPNEVPDAEDNVIFNENSFLQDHDTVFILTGNPVCKNMVWGNIADTVVIVGGSSNTTLSIYGSLTFHPKVINDYMGKIFFMSQLPGNTITCAGTRFPGDIWFEGEGEWILQDTLFVYDSTDWKVPLYGGDDPAAPNPVIIHNNGTFNSNEQVIITRGFATASNKPRTCIIENSDILMVGNWTLNAENLNFNAANSYILIGGTMNNFAGELINYHDIDFLYPDGSIKNTSIRTYMRKVHFLGSGNIDGKRTPGQEGSFTIDTLLFDGAITMMGPIECGVSGPYHYIHYTRVEQVHAKFEVIGSYFHRIDLNGSDFGGFFISKFLGLDNEIDSIMFNVPIGVVSGNNLINNLLFFNTTGTLGSWTAEESNVNHAIFSGDGFINGRNTINRLTLNTGFWYQIAADSLAWPGGYYTNTNVQTINQIEVIGDCYTGFSILTSSYKYTQALINYTGSGFITEYLMVKDIKNNGAIVDVDKGIDLGNNIGFNFTNPHPPRTLYWVGGDGNWDDYTHWSTASGVVPGDQCPPTLLDNVFFDSQSGFADSGMMVNVNVKHAFLNDMTWQDDVQNLPMLSGQDTCFMHIWGSVKLNHAMSYLYGGKVYFESEDDIEYETLDLSYTIEVEPGVFEIYEWMFNQVYFFGKDGKWQFDSKYVNYYDTTFLKMGTILLENDTIICLNFNSDDTLAKGIYFLGKTYCEVHQYQAEAWLLNAYGVDSTFLYDFGESTIVAYGDISPPMGAPPGFCNIRTFAGEVEYHNIQFSDPDVKGIKSILISESKCTYNLVDYYILYGDGVGNGVIDTLTYKRVIDPLTLDTICSADGCKLRNNYDVSFVMAESFGDTLIGNHNVDTAFFFDDGAIFGYHEIGYLQANKFMHLILMNQVDTAVFYSNGAFSGRNSFSQMTLSPNKRYFFQHDLEDITQHDTTIINDDLILTGYCDMPIRLQSDSIGTKAYILYKAQQPSNTEYTAKYVSMRDIYMVPHPGNQYIAENSINLGNNTNWDFIETSDEIYYWIGGVGNWGDWTHWSYTSGGPPIEDKCTPKEINTVIFDDNSFLTLEDIVTIDVLNAYCKNMYWKNSANFKPTFAGADSTVLYIYGSLELSDSLNYLYNGRIYFDQFVEPNFVADTITSRGHVILNDITFQGIDDIVLLGDDLTLLTDVDPPKSVYLEHGSLILNGKHLFTGGFFSVFKNSRTLNLVNSQATVKYDYDRAWYVDGENLNLLADNSTIYNESFMGAMMTEYGDYLKFNDIVLNGPIDSLANKGNITEYNVISINKESGLVTGNFIADTIYLRGRNSAMFKNSVTNVVYIDSIYGSINQKHDIKRCFVNEFAFIRGNNNIEYCIFYDDGVFMGQNVFDTLVLYPGSGNAQGLGNWYYFQSDSTQTINDSLYVRGNQCSNINLTSLSSPKLAYLKKDNGPADVSCDYLNIYSVAAESENLQFYAGANSTPLPNPDNPPPGWIFDNAQGYIYGFNGTTERFCLGDEYIIDAGDFNGDENTLYYWDGSPFPGEQTYTVSEPGTYHVLVQYFDGCSVEDYIVVEGNYPPVASIEPGPFCEGDTISVYVLPDNDAYKYEWSSGDSTSQIIASLELNGGIYVRVIDTTNNCEVSPNMLLTVKPAPNPEVALGSDVTVKFGQSATLYAGEGDEFIWTSEPQVSITDPGAQTIIVPGYTDSVEYKVVVTLGGCISEGYKIVSMYPPSKLGIPTAFSPNDDGMNDLLEVKGSGFKELLFRVYDRYGKLVFETTDLNIGWDGNVSGGKQEMEVYTYYVKVLYQDGGVAEEKGNITLLR